MENLNKYIDHTNLKRDAVASEIEKTINEAIEYKFKTICIHPTWIEFAQARLKDVEEVGITTVIGFPFGTQSTETKVAEAKDAIIKGADELDFVINVGKLHDNDIEYIVNEMKLTREATNGKVIKLILETNLLTEDEIRLSSKLAMDNGYNFIKTSTGINVEGATVEAVTIMKDVVGDNVEIKASGGVRSIADAEAMIKAGATRIGTSNGVDIILGNKVNGGY